MVDGEKLAVEQFMQVYYRWAQALAQLRELIMQAFDREILHPEEDRRPLPINEDFEVKGGLLSARHDDTFTRHPANLLKAFVILANNPTIVGIAPGTWRLLRAAHDCIDPGFRADPDNQALFMELLRSPHGVTLQLRRMARHGLLGRYLPEFGRIVGQMQFDLFHAYTVEAHTLEVLANTRRFMRADYTDKFPVSTRIAQRLRAPELLYIAALIVQESSYRVSEVLIGDPVCAVGGFREVPPSHFVCALGACLDAFQTAMNCEVDGLVIAHFKV